MKNIMTLAAAAALALSSCGLVAPDNGPVVTGQFKPNSVNQNFPAGTTKLALIPRGLGGVFGTKYAVNRAVVDTELTRGFALALPKTAEEGRYSVVAYIDANNNNSLDNNERSVANPNRYVIYSNGSFSYDGRTFESGWSYYDDNTNTVVRSAPFTNNDLTYPEGS